MLSTAKPPSGSRFPLRFRDDSLSARNIFFSPQIFFKFILICIYQVFQSSFSSPNSLDLGIFPRSVKFVPSVHPKIFFILIFFHLFLVFFFFFLCVCFLPSFISRGIKISNTRTSTNFVQNSIDRLIYVYSRLSRIAAHKILMSLRKNPEQLLLRKKTRGGKVLERHYETA